MADTEMSITNVLLDESVGRLKFVLRANEPPPPPPGVDQSHWIPTALEVITQPVSISRGSATQPSGMYITYTNNSDGSTTEHYWKYTWNSTTSTWGNPVETNRLGVPL